MSKVLGTGAIGDPNHPEIGYREYDEKEREAAKEARRLAREHKAYEKEGDDK